MWLAVIKSLRLRTLPLAISGIGLAAICAYLELPLHFKSHLVLPAIATAIFLQILSNVANDYGDFIKGTDQKAGRTDRMTQTLSEATMLKLVIVFGCAALLSGVLLLWQAFGFNSTPFWGMLLLGLAGIAAAVFYTMGKKPYGYRALGDVSVFIFFGLVAVVGGFYLFTGKVSLGSVLPAISIGFLSVGVLTINNFRDIETDTSAGKITVPVKLGKTKTRKYLFVLTVLAVCTFAAYQVFVLGAHPMRFFTLLFFFPHLQVCMKLNEHTETAQINVFLKIYALSTAVLVLAFWLLFVWM